MKRSIIIIITGLSLAIIIFLSGYFWLKNRTRLPQIEQTLAIIKSDAVKAHNTGKIIDRIEQEGFKIIDLRKVTLEREQAEKLYENYRGKRFFHELTDFMIGEPLVILLLEKLNAITSWRDLMGNQNPTEAKNGTLRKQFGTNIGKNAVHGSANIESAQREIRFFFADRKR